MSLYENSRQPQCRASMSVVMYGQDVEYYAKSRFSFT